MPVLSTLCRANKLINVINKTSFCNLLSRRQQNAFKQAVRNMSGEEDRTFHITPTRYHYTKFKDTLHFYITLGVVPLGLLILYVNIFIGPATLEEIPEGYEPRHWEYYKHPIKRFFSRYCNEDPQIAYEQVLHALHEEKERRDWSDTIDKARALMRERNDYKDWTHIPSDQGRHYRYVRKIIDDLDENKGFK